MQKRLGGVGRNEALGNAASHFASTYPNTQISYDPNKIFGYELDPAEIKDYFGKSLDSLPADTRIILGELGVPKCPMMSFFAVTGAGTEINESCILDAKMRYWPSQTGRRLSFEWKAISSLHEISPMAYRDWCIGDYRDNFSRQDRFCWDTWSGSFPPTPHGWEYSNLMTPVIVRFHYPTIDEIISDCIECAKYAGTIAVITAVVTASPATGLAIFEPVFTECLKAKIGDRVKDVKVELLKGNSYWSNWNNH